MATNRAMVEAARRHLVGDDQKGVTVYNAPILAAAIKEMSDFALEQSALAVAAERTRIGDELQKIWTENDSSTIWPVLDTYIDKLRAERANDED